MNAALDTTNETTLSLVTNSNLWESTLSLGKKSHTCKQMLEKKIPAELGSNLKPLNFDRIRFMYTYSIPVKSKYM